MNNLKQRYGVTTQRDLLRAIRDEYARETGEPYTLFDAELMLDGMLEAEYQRIEGGAYDRPSPEPSDAMNFRHPSTCDCEQCEDPRGEQRPDIEVYGTPEHEAWLMDLERRGE